MADSFALDDKPIKLGEVQGFRAGVAACGVRQKANDVGVVYCESKEGNGTAVFASTGLRAAPVRVSSPRASAGRLHAVVVTAGCANFLTGERGMSDTREIVDLVAEAVDVGQESVLAASHGPGGTTLPMDKLRDGVKKACQKAKGDGTGDFGSVVAGTTSGLQRISASGMVDDVPFRIAGVAKGASATSADMSKMYAFLVTDIVISPACLREILISIAHTAYGMLGVDAGSGPNDTLCVLASGAAGNEPIDNVFSAGTFADALTAVAVELAASAPEGAENVPPRIEVTVKGAPNETEAETAARSVADSPALKIALASKVPGWELALAAAGRVIPKLDETKAQVRVAGELLFDKGEVPTAPGDMKGKLDTDPLPFEIDLGLGSARAKAWGEQHPSGEGGKGGRAQVELKAAKEAAKKAQSEAATLRRETTTLKADLKKRDDELASLKKDLTQASKASGDAKKAHDEMKKVTIRLQKTEVELEQAKATVSLKEQLVKQLIEEQPAPKSKKKKKKS